MKVLLRAPLLTNSGYGVHSRQIFNWLEGVEGIELFVQCLNWGKCAWIIKEESHDGMIGRIMLSQFRESLDEMKERTEEQVDRSVRKLKEQLDSSIDMLAQQTENITRNTDRALRDNSASLKFFMDENNKILKENNKVLEETIHTSKHTIDEFNSRVSEVSLKLAKIKIPTDDFQNFEKSVNTFVSSLNSLEKGIQESNTKEELIETAKSFKSLSTSINQQSKILNNEFVVTKETLENLSKNLVSAAKFISENLKTK